MGHLNLNPDDNQSKTFVELFLCRVGVLHRVEHKTCLKISPSGTIFPSSFILLQNAHDGRTRNKKHFCESYKVKNQLSLLEIFIFHQHLIHINWFVSYLFANAGSQCDS
mmetsp:Transcript_10674/g.19717  ORF Transcript_10674/g.19717 Transcript_10674/m.19717 type:complete len:109 (-) Transcript_10674:386-712(-)